VGVSVAECEDLVESPVVGCESTTPTSPDDTQHLYFITDLCLTPTVTNITTNTDQSLQGVRGGVQVRGGSELTIGGSGFSTVLCQVQVQVGAATCTVITSSLTSLTCNLDDLSHLVSLVPFPLQVTIINRGTANTEVSSNEHNIDVIVVPVVTSLQPTEGSLAGGTIVTIKGSGLQAFDNIASVKLGSNSCKVVSVSPTSITCSSPPAPAGSVLLYLTLSALKIPVELEQGMEFTFSDTVTSSVSNVSVSGETFNITGSLFGSDPSKVIVTFIKTSARRKRTAENYDGPSVFDEDDISNEETVSGRIKRHASDSFDAFDKFLDAGNMWSAVTNTPTMSIRERREVWRVAGSLPAADEAPVLKVSRVRRDTDQTEFPCEPSSVSDENIVCQSAGLPAGTYTISVSIDGLGNAAVNQDVEVTTSPVVTMVIPTEGSINGGTLLTLIGSGFTPGEVSVTTGGQVCQVESASVNGITCRTSAHDAGAVDVVLSSAGVTITSPSAFTYLTANSPVLTTITPSMDVEVGTVLTVSGTGLRLSGSDPEVLIGGTTCTVTAATDTTVTCSAPDLAGGSHAVVVRDSQYGDSNGDRSVTYSFSITSVSPTTGGFGGIDIVISGHGFDPEGGTTVGVCGSTCTSNPTSTSTSITCTVPPKIPDGVTVVACDVVVSNPDGSQQTASNGFTYDGNFTPTITGASPARGGTAGGTQLTITGDN
ncbi:Fibrocystin-L-like 3, partial [Homarus americanus]